MFDERDTENVLEQVLENLGWHTKVGDPDRNVYHHEPRSEEEAKQLKVKLSGQKHNYVYPDFILYPDSKSHVPIAIIEVKRPQHRTLEDAKDQGMTYAKKLHAKFLFLYNVNRFIDYYIDSNDQAYPLLVDDQEAETMFSLSDLKQFKGNKLFKQEAASIKSKTDLINVFKTANEKLREAGVNAGIARFTEFSNLLFLKLVSELNESRNFNISEQYLWSTYANMPAISMLDYINNTVIPGLNKRFDSSESNPLFTKLTINNPTKLKEIVDKLDTVNLAKINTDVKGDAFEYFIQKYNQTNNDLGEYFTPRHLVKFLNDILQPKFGEKVYDPFCGTGGMLIVAFKYIFEELSDKGILNDTNLEQLRSNTIWGGEISTTARIAKMNMILAGDGHSNVAQHDSFTHPVSDRFDVVISNIPFNLNVSDEQVQSYIPYIKNGNAAAISHILKSMSKSNPNARAAIIVPEAVLNDSKLTELRRYIVKANLLKGIVSLPAKIFLPYTEAKTSVLIFGGEGSPQTSDIFVYKAESDGYTLTTRRRPMPGINDLDEFLSVHEQIKKSHYLKKIDNPKLIYLPRTKILKNDRVSLLPFRYFDKLKSDNIRLKDILERVKIKNTLHYPTASISNDYFWGMPDGKSLWGDSFFSVTSKDNSDYSVVGIGDISFNPSRANVGSIGINESHNFVAVSSAYPVYQVKSGQKYLPEYIYLELKHNPEVIQDINARAYGTVRQSLGSKDFEQLQIPVLPIEEQTKLVKLAREKFGKLKKLQKELAQFNVPIS